MKNFTKAVSDIVGGCRVSFIGSIGKDGFPNMKAMLPPRKHTGIKTFYFTTNTSSLRVSQFRKNSKACIYFFDGRFYKGVMLTGIVKILEDLKSKKMIWKEGDTMYYPLGVTDPDYCVIKFTAQKGRFYQNFSSKDFEIK